MVVNGPEVSNHGSIGRSSGEEFLAEDVLLASDLKVRMA